MSARGAGRLAVELSRGPAADGGPTAAVLSCQRDVLRAWHELMALGLRRPAGRRFAGQRLPVSGAMWLIGSAVAALFALFLGLILRAFQ
jgi:hypothetical protein